MWDTVLTLRECMLKNLGMTWLIYVDVRQKSTQYCKAIILQLKINFKLKNRVDNEISEFLSDVYFIHEEKDFSNSKKKNLK